MRFLAIFGLLFTQSTECGKLFHKLSSNENSFSTRDGPKIKGAQNSDVMLSENRKLDMTSLPVSLKLDIANLLFNKYVRENEDGTARMWLSRDEEWLPRIGDTDRSENTASSSELDATKAMDSKRHFGFIGCNGWAPSCNNFGTRRRPVAVAPPRLMTSERTQQAPVLTANRMEGEYTTTDDVTAPRGARHVIRNGVARSPSSDMATFLTSGERFHQAYSILCFCQN